MQSKALTGWTPPAPTFHSGAGVSKKFSRRYSSSPLSIHVAEPAQHQAPPLALPVSADELVEKPFSPLNARARISMDNWSFYSTDAESDGGADTAQGVKESLISPKRWVGLSL